MIEARVFIDSLDNAKSVLSNKGATFQGYYEISDTIYRNIDATISLTDEFLRLREVPVNIWPEKEIILALKQTNLRSIGKNSEIPIKLQYDLKTEAEEYYQQNLANNYTFDFSFSRVGWQYFLKNGDVIDLEIIEEAYPSIEFKSETDEGITELLKEFDISSDEVISGPSVVATKKLLSI